MHTLFSEKNKVHRKLFEAKKVQGPKNRSLVCVGSFSSD